MSREWISGGGPAAPTWDEGDEITGMPGVQVAAGSRVRVFGNALTRVLLVGDVCVQRHEEERLLEAAAAGQWAELTSLPGSYWVLAQSGSARFVCGDVSGLRAVFYVQDGPHTMWSTSAARLAALRSAGPDLAMAAARLAAGPEHWPQRTLYEDVRAVPPGCGLLLGRAQPELVDVSGITATLTLAQGAAAFGDALERSVVWRMRDAGGRAGADVSGGLDSSSLAILASTVGTVTAVTYADPYTSSEDLAYARRVATHMGTTLEVGTGGVDELPFRWSEDQPVTDQPAAVSLTTAQHALYLRPAAGLPLHFTGAGGDVVLDSCSAAWVGMVQSGERREAHRQVTGWARARNRSPRALWRAVTAAAGTGHAGALDKAAARIERGDIPERPAGVWSWCHLGRVGTWLTPRGREQVAALLRDAARSAQPEARADLVEQQMSLRLVAADARDTGPLTAPWRIRQVHPYLDNQVVRAAFAITPVERHGVTTFKPLLAAAVPSLPTWLTSRHSKGSFTRQLTAGMLHHRRRLGELIAASPLVTRGLLDAEPALAALAGVGGTHSTALFDLQRTIMVCQWLDAHHRQMAGAAC